jgi:hypothetical protein
VAEPFLEHLGVFARRHQQRGVGVSQIIQANGRQLGPLEQWLEVAVDDVLRVEEPARFIREDQALIFVQLSNLQPPLSLPDSVLLEAGRVPTAPSSG